MAFFAVLAFLDFKFRIDLFSSLFVDLIPFIYFSSLVTFVANAAVLFLLLELLELLDLVLLERDFDTGLRLMYSVYNSGGGDLRLRPEMR